MAVCGVPAHTQNKAFGPLNEHVGSQSDRVGLLSQDVVQLSTRAFNTASCYQGI